MIITRRIKTEKTIKKALIVVDMQHDFVDGALGSAAAQAIVPNVKKRIAEYKENEDYVLFTKDTHYTGYMNTNEGKHLPVPHCISGTYGWRILDELYEEGDHVVMKPTFGYIPLATINGLREADEIELIGLCTDICVMSNAIILKAAFPEKTISVNLDCTAATSEKTFEASVEIFKSCQIELIGG
jgi:nicotinamidase-related amidase